jgi:hypothetical protein
MAMAIGGNIVTAWSWFGVNMLSIGLHSYGFTESGLLWLLAWVGFNLGIIGVSAVVPEKTRDDDTRGGPPPPLPSGAS